MSNVFLYDGEKSVSLNNLPPEAWTILSGDREKSGIGKLYGLVSWLYRCVNARSNAVAAMPYTLIQGKKVIATWTGTEFEEDVPDKLSWLHDLPVLLAKTEAAVCLMGAAYWEPRKNMFGNRTLTYQWLLPDSIKEKIDKREGLKGFERRLGGQPIQFGPEDLIYFWLPDWGVEIGRAVNTPGKAVLQNAGVIHSMDVFLHGYFDRGLIKAFIGKYTPQGNNSMLVPPNTEEVSRYKSFLQRVLFGAKNSSTFEIFRSDFSIETIGEGLKDLRDNNLTADEKKDIAVGMGVPLSKIDSTAGTDSNRNADDVQFIQDTIVPEIGWIFAVLNKQIFEPLGIRIKANPDTLAVMQEDETQRAAAWGAYVNAGMSMELATAILGIDVPDGMEIKEPPKPIPPALQPFAAPTEEQPNDVIEKSAVMVLDLLDKREESKQFQRWLKNRNYTAVNVQEFTSEYLSEKEKIQIAIKAIQAHTPYKASLIDDLQIEYGNQLAKFIDNAIRNELDRPEFVGGMRDVVVAGLMSIFKTAAGVPDDESLSLEEELIFNRLVGEELSHLTQYISDIYMGLEGEKATRFDRVRDKLQNLAGNLGGRLSMWTNAARLFYNSGMIHGRKDVKMRWDIGATEQHCSDCLLYNGQTKTRQEWQELAGVLIYPQSRALECKGYMCDCRLSEV